MKVLVIGGGGREHVLAETYAKSARVRKVFVAPGNGLIDFQNQKIITCQNVGMLNFEEVLRLCKKHQIDLVDVAQDDVIAAGFVDKLEKEGIQTFGPTQKAAEIEWSKEWARNFMVKYHLPIPRFQSFSNEESAIRHVRSLPEQMLYIKASGLCGGKGAVRTETKNQAIDAIKSMKQFGKSGETFLIEEALAGEEFSLFAICDGDRHIITKSAQDHKTVFNADTGPNTGGMGCIAPTNAVTRTILQEVEKHILKPFMKGMIQEKRPYVGILYLGGMITNPPTGGGVKIIEFNSRWGSPEAEVILPSIKTDYTKIVEAVRNRKLNKLSIRFDNKVRVSVAGCSRGYPNDYSAVKGKEIFGLAQAMRMKGITVFGSGIVRKGKRFFVDGGRVFHLVAEGSDIIQARKRAYEAMSLIYIEGNNLHYRTDIGWRDVARAYI